MVAQKTLKDPKVKKKLEKFAELFHDVDALDADDDAQDLAENEMAENVGVRVFNKDESEGELDGDVSYFANLKAIADPKDDPDYDRSLLHPAELAAKFQIEHDAKEENHRSNSGGDEQILRDLRKAVFSVPLLHQKDVHNLFIEMDNKVFPIVYKILEVSDLYLEKIVQIVIKVAAGNTYGKNIYERPDGTAVKTDYKGTYKEHEIHFMKNAFELLRFYARIQSKPTLKTYDSVLEAISKCAFIRGVYEEILQEFVADTKHYMSLHWIATKAKIENNAEEYYRTSRLIKDIEAKLRLNKTAYYVIREAAKIHKEYVATRAIITAPYLRSVYSTAKNTAKNAHQMLDNFQNGAIGLVRAVSCYSTRRPASFASVAKWWIKQMMLLSIKEDANFVKLPVSTWQAFTQLEKVRNKLGASDEDIDEVARQAKMPTKKARAVYDTIKIAQVYSLNKTYDANEKLTLEDIVTNEDKLGGGTDEFGDLLREYCDKANLSPVENKILALRHGILDIIPMREVDPVSLKKECIIQNLASLGYCYRFNN